MNGFIFMEIARFGVARLTEQGWQDALRCAGMPVRTYYRVGDYPDAEALAQLAAITAATGEPLGVLLTDLGEFMAPDLLKMAKYWIRDDWKTLELVEHTEQTIHEVLREQSSGTSPPQLRCRRTSMNEVIVTYTSARRMCNLARGIIAGIASHYAETVSVSEPVCMLRGDDRCELILSRKP